MIALALGTVVRLGIFTQTSDLGPEIVDERHYTQLAGSLLAGHGFAWGPGEPTSSRPPAYPAVLAATWIVAGDHNYQAVRAVQLAFAAATAWLVYLLARRAFDERVAAYAAAAFWLYPSSIFFQFTILTETMFTMLLVAFVLLATMLVQSPRLSLALACGLVLGLGALTRSVLWPVPVVLCPMLLWLIAANWRTRLLLSAAVLAGYAVVVGPWAVRNTTLQNAFTVVDTLGGFNLRMGNYQYTPEDRMWDVVSDEGQHNWSQELRLEYPNQRFTDGQKAAWAQRKAFEYMWAHPGQTFRRSLIKFADFWGLEREFVAGVQKQIYKPPAWFAVLATVLIIGAYIVLAAAGAAGLWLVRPTLPVHVLLLFPVLVITAAHSLTFGHSRYHAPLMPMLVIYAAALFVERRAVRDRSRRALWVPAVVTILVLIAVWARQVIIVDAERLTRLLHG